MQRKVVIYERMVEEWARVNGSWVLVTCKPLAK